MVSMFSGSEEGRASDRVDASAESADRVVTSNTHVDVASLNAQNLNLKELRR